MDIMDSAMLSQPAMPDSGTAPSIGKFFKYFFAFYVFAAMTGEMFYDGDFTKPRTAPAAIMRGCVEAFRASPFTAELTSDISTPASAMENANGNDAVRELRKAGFALGDATALYAGRLVHNDRVLYGEKSASHVLPQVFFSDTCRVRIFLKKNQVTGAFAYAVRESQLPRFFPSLLSTLSSETQNLIM